MIISLIFSAVLASMFLDEQLGRDGKLGCALCIIGSVVVIVHAPKEKEVDSINDMLNYALNVGT